MDLQYGMKNMISHVEKVCIEQHVRDRASSILCNYIWCGWDNRNLHAVFDLVVCNLKMTPMQARTQRNVHCSYTKSINVDTRQGSEI